MGRIVALTVLTCALCCPMTWAQQLSGGGSWQSTNAEPVKGKWTAALTLSKQDVQGTLTLDGSNVFTGGKVEGTLTDGQIVLGVFQQGTKAASFAGKFDGETVSGEWSCPAIADEGVWEGNLRGMSK